MSKRSARVQKIITVTSTKNNISEGYAAQFKPCQPHVPEHTAIRNNLLYKIEGLRAEELNGETDNVAKG